MQICLFLSEEKIKTARSLLFAELAVEEIKKELCGVLAGREGT